MVAKLFKKLKLVDIGELFYLFTWRAYTINHIVIKVCTKQELNERR